MSLRSAKAEINSAYYHRHKDNPEFREKVNARSRAYYARMKDDPEFKRKHIARTQRWREANRERHNLQSRCRKYGISVDEYKVLTEASGGLCGVCRQDKPLCVDHCHTTGKVRGLLCNECNAALGFLEEDVARMEALITYTAKL